MQSFLRRIGFASAVAICGLLAAFARTSTAAPTIPAWSFTLHCTDYGANGIGGDVILAQPNRIDGQPGLGLQSQYIYYLLEIYTPSRGWTASNVKRVVDSYATSIEEAQEWDPQYGLWYRATDWDFSPSSDVSNGQLYQDLQIPNDDVGLHAPQGPGTFSARVYIYWAPPFSVWPSPSVYAAAAGGIWNNPSTVSVKCS